MFNNLNYGFHSTELGRHNNVWNENCFCNVLNCGVGDDKIQNILWQAQNLPTMYKGICSYVNIYVYIYIYIYMMYIYIYTYIYTYHWILPTWRLQLINKSILYKQNLKWNCVQYSFSFVNQGTNCFLKSGTVVCFWAI